MKVFLSKKLKKVEHRCLNHINSFRNEVMHEARAYIKNKLEATTKMLTNQHHNVIQKFLEFKDETVGRLERN